MAMDRNLLSAPINKIPWGLLDFFNLKSMGETPKLLADRVSGVFDLARFYADNNAMEGRAGIAALAANTAGSNIAITSAMWTATGGSDFADGAAQTVVPQTEMWWLLEGNVSWTLDTAGQDADFTLTSSLSAASWPLTDSDVMGYNTGAAIARQGRRNVTSPKMLRPGAVLVVSCLGAIVPGGTVAASVNVRIVRMKL